MRGKSFFFTGIFCLVSIFFAQAQQPVQFYFDKVKNAAGEFELRVKAKPEKGIRLFSVQPISADLPVNTSISFDTAAKRFLADSINETGTMQTAVEPGLNNATIKFYTDSVEWIQKIKLQQGDSTRIIGSINYYYKKGESIESGEQRISMQFQYTADAPAEITNTSGTNSKSLWALLIAGIAAGLIGFLTPCVYALVPITVSFFTKRSKTTAQGKINALFYSFCIVLIYNIRQIHSDIISYKYIGDDVISRHGFISFLNL